MWKVKVTITDILLDYVMGKYWKYILILLDVICILYVSEGRRYSCNLALSVQIVGIAGALEVKV